MKNHNFDENINPDDDQFLFVISILLCSISALFVGINIGSWLWLSIF